MKVNIRKETPEDFRRVEEVTKEAFWNVYVPGCSEHFVIHNLRRSSDFIPELSLVAETEGSVVGHIAYSKASIVHEDGSRTDALCVGPLSVLPEYQGKGIGGQLIRNSLDRARDMGYGMVVLTGDPHYYRRFGFRVAERYDLQTADGKYAAAMLAKELRPGASAGSGGMVVESDAYAVDEAAFDAFDATFPQREKGYAPSQDKFNLLCTMMYD